MGEYNHCSEKNWVTRLELMSRLVEVEDASISNEIVELLSSYSVNNRGMRIYKSGFFIERTDYNRIFDVYDFNVKRKLENNN